MDEVFFGCGVTFMLILKIEHQIEKYTQKINKICSATSDCYLTITSKKRMIMIKCVL